MLWPGWSGCLSVMMPALRLELSPPPEVCAGGVSSVRPCTLRLVAVPTQGALTVTVSPLEVTGRTSACTAPADVRLGRRPAAQIARFEVVVGNGRGLRVRVVGGVRDCDDILFLSTDARGGGESENERQREQRDSSASVGARHLDPHWEMGTGVPAFFVEPVRVSATAVCRGAEAWGFP